jgi:hypothetical protein
MIYLIIYKYNYEIFFNSSAINVKHDTSTRNDTRIIKLTIKLGITLNLIVSFEKRWTLTS